MIVALLTISGAFGALGRYLVTGAVHRKTDINFPIGTLVVNLGGAFLLGIVVGWGGIGQPWPATVSGFLGGFTTFSTWMIETVRFGEIGGLRFRALLNLSLTLFAGIALAFLGYTLSS